MPRIESFPGLRYDETKVSLTEVIAPPYDVVGPGERKVLAERSPANAIHVELPEEAGTLDRYQHAAALLKDWRKQGLLRQDPSPAIYPYTMTSPDGSATSGFIAAVAIDCETGPGALPHEETLPKARSDRLDLLEATEMNLSPVWCLSLASKLTEDLQDLGESAGQATDEQGVLHRIWVLDDPRRINAVKDKVASAQLLIADGHHRFATARTYRDQHNIGGQDLATYVMALVVELAEDQIALGPIHRAIRGLPKDVDLPGAFSTWFEVSQVSSYKQALPMGLLTKDQAWAMSPKKEAFDAARSDLDAGVVELVLRSLPPHELDHPHTTKEALEAIGKAGDAEAVILMRAVTVAQIKAWSKAGRRMPAKTTYFTPKPRTGLVYRSIDGTSPKE